MGIWDKVRDVQKWIDGQESDAVKEYEKAAPQPIQSSAEALKKRLLQEIENTMRDQMFSEPGGTVYVPGHFVVFLNPQDDNQLRSEMRQRMESALGGHALERAQDLNKQAKITVKAIRVELRVDGTLEAGELRAEAVSSDPAAQTQTTRRSNVNPAPTPAPVSTRSDATIKDDGTIKDTGAAAGVLYRLEVWRDGNCEQDIPVVRRSLTVGRETSSGAANVRLKTTDRRISGLHFELLHEGGERLVVAVFRDKNAVLVGGVLVSGSGRGELPPGGEIVLYDFVFRPVWAKP